MLKRIAVALFASVILALPVAAEQWSLDDMNKTIEQTNFIVDNHCSGTLVRLKEPLVLTNFHCIGDSIEIVKEEVDSSEGFIKTIKRKRYHDVPVRQDMYDGYSRVRSTTYVSEIIAEDQKRDLAVLRIQGTVPQTYATPLLPDGSTVTRGETIYTVGNPAMLESSVFQGVVSNVNRTFEFPWTGGEKTPMIQFSGGIVGGNSGGALYNTKGQLIGVPAAGSRASDVLGYAIPATTVKAFMREACLASAFDDKADDKACQEKKKDKEKSDKDSD